MAARQGSGQVKVRSSENAVPLQAARLLFLLSLLAVFCEAGAQTVPDVAWQASQTFETTFQSKKTYADPFAVEVDAIFTRGSSSWRVPAFWRGERKWGVRFTPPAPPGDFA